jgi:hypothetical protein
LQEKELTANSTPEESELILSGLILEKKRKLRVYNRIYESVFDSSWVTEMLADKRPYAEELTAWLASERKDTSMLLLGQKLQKAIEWCDGKILTIEDYQFINASQELEINLLKANQESQIANLETKIQNSKRFQRLLTGISASMIIITGLSGFQLKEKIQSLFTPYISNPELFSQGEETFFLGNGNLYQNLGIDAFKKRIIKKQLNNLKKPNKLI